MGVQLGDLVAAREISFDELAGKRIAIDAFNTLYQFLSIIRQPTGEPLRDSQGRVTSHLSGILYRNANLIEFGVLPVYVFDGEPPKLKSKVIKERNQMRERAREEWERALKEERYEEAWSKAVQSAKLTDAMLSDAKRLLTLLGIPYVEAPAEGEAQAAYMAKRGDVFAAGSQDYDSLLFGSPRLVRNLTISGKRKLPRKKAYVDVKPEIITLDEVLRSLGVSREQLIDIAILIGTDYNPGGVEGIGPKKAYALIKEHGSAERALEAKGIEVDFDVTEIRELFLNHKTTDDYKLEWHPPDKEGVVAFLCGERDFSRERVEKALEKMEKALKVTRAQRSLDSWFK
jgi:flap endonuclease-1